VNGERVYVRKFDTTDLKLIFRKRYGDSRRAWFDPSLAKWGTRIKVDQDYFEVAAVNVVVTCEQHFSRTPDGQVWTDGQFAYSFWTRYLSVFDSVDVVARVRDIAMRTPGHQAASGTNVTFSGVPDYRGPEQYLFRFASVAAATARAVQNSHAVILRVPSQVGSCVERHLRKIGRPYAVEVVTDSYDVFAPGGVRHPLRPLFRWWSPRRLRSQCAAACAAAYVTEHALQRRYPASKEAFTTHYSDVELPPSAFVNVSRISMPNGAAKLIFVGSLAQLYKAPDVLIDAIAACVHDGLDLELVLVGSGRYQSKMETRALALGLGSRVQFCGQLTTPEAVRRELDQAHLFVLPSRVEGLPRAMIEAMARALPCLGSTVGGIPELLPSEDLVAADDAPGLTKKIHEVLADPARMRRMSARNLQKARAYAEGPGERRLAFYREIKLRTQAWLQANGASLAPTSAEASGRKC
jgi:glycosyltransferase involved in cell wall biosynthesis